MNQDKILPRVSAKAASPNELFTWMPPQPATAAAAADGDDDDVPAA